MTYAHFQPSSPGLKHSQRGFERRRWHSRAKHMREYVQEFRCAAVREPTSPPWCRTRVAPAYLGGEWWGRTSARPKSKLHDQCNVGNTGLGFRLSHDHPRLGSRIVFLSPPCHPTTRNAKSEPEMVFRIASLTTHLPTGTTPQYRPLGGHDDG